MDKPISVGDLVVLVRGRTCCGKWPSNGSHHGKTYRVTRMHPVTATCGLCGKRLTEINAAGDGMMLGYESGRLKRIPPLEELDDVKRDEEVTA